jgi:putative spermidine/putrescine transport system permease protein
MRFATSTKVLFGSLSGLVLLIIYLPLIVVGFNSFNSNRNMVWPPPGFTLNWWVSAFHSAGLWEAVGTSVIVAIASTAIALLLGTLVAMALSRYKFFGRSSVNLLVVLPIALPGIVTGIALNNGFRTIIGLQLSLATVIVAHATFCVVTVFNNVMARLSRMNPNLVDASSDLGAGLWDTFRLVTFPQLRSALMAGGLLAFGLSFDEIIVTTFTAGSGVTTLPIWILNNMFRPGQAPVVNVIAVVLVVTSSVPIYFAQRLSGESSESARS